MTFDRARPLLPLGYMLALFALSSIPGDISTETPLGAAFQWVSPAWQNLLHIPLYAGLALAWNWALVGYSASYRGRLVIAFALTALWGLFDEIHQAGVPGRYGSMTDMALNLLGAGLAMAALVWKSPNPAQANSVGD